LTIKIFEKVLKSKSKGLSQHFLNRRKLPLSEFFHHFESLGNQLIPYFFLSREVFIRIVILPVESDVDFQHFLAFADLLPDFCYSFFNDVYQFFVSHVTNIFEHFQLVSVVQSVELPANDPVAILIFCDVGLEGGLNERETRRALDPVVANLTEKARVINSVEVLLENDIMLDLLKLFSQNFNSIDLFKHFFPTDRVNS
jgi:hypothetical protein